jgi:hypothetical protein
MRNRWISLTLGGVAALVAVGAGTAAVNAATTGSGHDVKSQADIANLLAAAPAPAATTATNVPATASDDGSQVANTVGGTVVVRCSGNVATLLRWSPKTGFRADDPVIGPSSLVSVRFESDVAEDVTVSVTCANGVAKATTTPEADDHGGNRGSGGPSPAPSATDDHGGSGGPGRGGHDDPPGDDSGSGGHGADDSPTHS